MDVNPEPTSDPAVISGRLQELHQRIESVAGSSDQVKVLAVSKRHPAEVVLAAMSIGIKDFGENYAQELSAKAEAVASVAESPNWHMIGGLQSNKIKTLSSSVSVWQTIDRAKLARAVASRAPRARVMVQVNSSVEPQKSGCAISEVAELVQTSTDLGLQVVGLMTMGPTDLSLDPRPGFAATRALVDSLGLEECSMGMSADLEAAVAEGSTMVRIGTALFGVRPN